MKFHLKFGSTRVPDVVPCSLCGEMVGEIFIPSHGNISRYLFLNQKNQYSKVATTSIHVVFIGEESAPWEAPVQVDLVCLRVFKDVKYSLWRQIYFFLVCCPTFYNLQFYMA